MSKRRRLRNRGRRRAAKVQGDGETVVRQTGAYFYYRPGLKYIGPLSMADGMEELTRLRAFRAEVQEIMDLRLADILLGPCTREEMIALALEVCAGPEVAES